MSEFPSKDNQFKAGQSGNSKGRPKGSRNRSTIVRELLEAKATVGDGQLVDQITRALIQKAAEGDVRAFKELMDSAYGKIKDSVESSVTYTQMGYVYLENADGSRKKMDFNVGEPVSCDYGECVMEENDL